MKIDTISILATKVFGREVTDPVLQQWSLVVMIMFGLSILLGVASLRLVDKEKAANMGPFGGNWMNRLSPVNVFYPFCVLTPLGKKMSVVGVVGIFVSIALFGAIWKLAE